MCISIWRRYIIYIYRGYTLSSFAAARRCRRRRLARFIGVMSDAAQGAFLFLFYFLTFILRIYVQSERLTRRAANRHIICIIHII